MHAPKSYMTRLLLTLKLLWVILLKMNFKIFSPFGKICFSVNVFPHMKISWECVKPGQPNGLVSVSYEIVASPSPRQTPLSEHIYCLVAFFCSVPSAILFLRLLPISFLLLIMVYNIEQAFNIHDSSTYAPQLALPNVNVYPCVSSPYYATRSNSSFEYTEGMYYPSKPPTNVNVNANAISNYYDDLTQLSPSPISSHHSPNASSSSLSSSPPTQTSHYYQNQNHSIHEIQVSQSVIATYVSHPTIDDLRSGWRPDFLKCNYPGCPSRAIDSSRLHSHLASHMNCKKAYGCSCGTKFGRLSEANRHLYDQSPCEVCGDSRRKQKGTNTCSRCYMASFVVSHTTDTARSL